MSRERIETDVYPTRYAAFDRPNVWAVFVPVNGLYRACREDSKPRDVSALGACREYPGEAAVLNVEVRSESYPDLYCGAYVEVLGVLPGATPKRDPLPGVRFLARCHYTAPASRASAAICASTLNEAIEKAEAWIAEVLS